MPELKIWQETLIYPIRLRMLNRTGYTLWAHSDDGQVTLALDRHFVWCRTGSSLREFLANDSSSNIAALAGYASFREAAIDGASEAVLKPQAKDYFDFDKAMSYLASSDWSEWSLRVCSNVLNCFNLLWDMAITMDDAEVMSDQRTDSEVHTFLDSLTVIAPEEIKELTRFDSGHISTVFAEHVARMARRVILLC